ncbi:MAG: CRISPR-associated endonuclease Cas1 [Cyanobacteria bacterium SBC]|nr:CRISPR-associated endonuclease Cas1 [Cyanobacteria bacterium SBC]
MTIPLYITEQGTYLSLKQKQLQVWKGDRLKVSVPLQRLSHIVIFGRCTLSHGVVNVVLKQQIPVMFLTQSGRYCGRLAAEGTAEIDRLVAQVDRGRDREFVLAQAQQIVYGKLHNCRVLLQRLNRSRRDEEIRACIATLKTWLDRALESPTVEGLLGCEGQGTRVYFQGLGRCIQPPFTFDGRTRRPPTDPVNSLLSLGYTLLYQTLFSLVCAVGLHPHFGNLHVPSSRYASLVSDLVEEFRAPLVDSVVVSLVNRGGLQLDDFYPADIRGAVYLRPTALKSFLKDWQERLQTPVSHPQVSEQILYVRVLEIQVWEYVACLVEDRSIYRPFCWKV